MLTGGRWEFRYATNHYIEGIWSWIVASHSVDPSQVNPPGINCLNGVLKLDWEGSKPSWRLVPHDPAMFYTYVGQFEFNPSADPANCDRLLECLELGQREVFLKTLAASLDLKMIRGLRGRSIKALLCKGEGNNGKDSLREAVQVLYGIGVVDCPIEDFVMYQEGRKFALTKLDQARVCWASENFISRQLDSIQPLKRAITGEELSFEIKQQQERPMKPSCIFLFNVNDVPNMQASLEAIQSRWAVLSFNKTFKTNADLSKGELEADPRFRYDSTFMQREVVPALLNKMLAELPVIALEGIDYGCTEQALKEVQRDANHLWAFCQDVGLEANPDGRIFIGELWETLFNWYLDNGYVEVTTDGKGKQKNVWSEPQRKSDSCVKAAHQIYQRFSGLFPKIKKLEDTSRTGKKGAWYLAGIAMWEPCGNLCGNPRGNPQPAPRADGEPGEPIKATLDLLTQQLQNLEHDQIIQILQEYVEEKGLVGSPGSPPHLVRLMASHIGSHIGSHRVPTSEKPTITVTSSEASIEGVSAPIASNSVAHVGNVNQSNSTKNFCDSNQHTFKVGDRAKAIHPKSHGIPEGKELTILKIDGNTASVTYEGCRAVFGVNIPVSQLVPIVPEFKVGDRVAHADPGQKSYHWHGQIVRFHTIGEHQKLFAEVKWRESRRQGPFIYELSDLRLI